MTEIHPPVEGTNGSDTGGNFTALKENVMSGVHDIEETVRSTREQAYLWNRKTVDFIREKPVVALAAAFGVGYVIGKLASKRWLV